MSPNSSVRRRVTIALLFPLLVLTSLVFSTSTASAQSPNLQICKDGSRGALNTSFDFTYQMRNGTPGVVNNVSVLGGSCTSVEVAQGRYRVTELPEPGFDLANITVNPAGRLVTGSLNLEAQRVMVRVPAPGENRTLVRFFNSNQTGTVKICKATTDPDVVALGGVFDFTLTGANGREASVDDLQAAIGQPRRCSNEIGPFPTGTGLTVAEADEPNTFLQSITVIPASRAAGASDLAAQSQRITVGAGVTEVVFTNEENPPTPGRGFIEICKESTGAFPLTGSFNFAVTGLANPVPVTVGQCSAPLNVPSGNVTVTEQPRTGTALADIDVFPDDREVSRNLTNRSITVVVPNDPDSSNETLVTFANRAVTGQFKVCKLLAANASDLTGRTFTFNTSAVGPISVVASAPGNEACSTPRSLPIGTQVTVTEVAQPNVENTAVTLSPASAGSGSPATGATFTIGSGIVAARFTNQALGQLQVCKVGQDAPTQGVSFTFTINGTITRSVRAGTSASPNCTPLITVPAGTATVAETVPAGYFLVGVTARSTGTPSSNRLISGPTDNPSTVSVPFSSTVGGNPTRVTFTNARQRGDVKLCKAVLDDDLQGMEFDFTVQVGANGPLVLENNIPEGQCRIVAIDVFLGTPVTIREPLPQAGIPAGTFVDSITVTGDAGGVTTSTTNPATASFTVAGTNEVVVTFFNDFRAITPL